MPKKRLGQVLRYNLEITSRISNAIHSSRIERRSDILDIECSHSSLRCVATSSRLESTAAAVGNACWYQDKFGRVYLLSAGSVCAVVWA